MRIAIVGTRGIPNNYGGFEQLAHYLSLGLKDKGHQVFVYSSNQHPYQGKIWNGINIIHRYDPEKKIGTIGQFVYDLLCILNTRRHRFDVILNLGYTSSSIWMKLFPKKSTVITNMDGLEWKRTKFNKYVQRFLMHAEKLAVKNSDLLIADSLAIKTYIFQKYQVPSHFIAYGAHLFNEPQGEVLALYKLRPYGYNMLIARMEPENNIEMILDGVHHSTSDKPFLVVGNYQNGFGKYLSSKYRDDTRIMFAGPVYDGKTINNLRYFSNLYFHGHSVGGTNPSLLEAMGCQCLIAAHNNEFNKSVLEDNAFYFNNADQVCELIENTIKQEYNEYIINNYSKVGKEYSWAKIIDEYEQVMLRKHNNLI